MRDLLEAPPNNEIQRFAGLGMCFVVSLLIVGRAAQCAHAAEAVLSGELRRWHKMTLTIDGPQAAENSTPNPLLDYRMQIVFRHAETGLTYRVPGYCAADGNAANSSATSGHKWRAHLALDRIGKWSYTVSFRGGPRIAVADASGQDWLAIVRPHESNLKS